jgi:hypothetical protein
LQDPSEANEDNLSNVRREAIAIFKKKERKYMKEKLMSFSQTVRIRKSETCVST